MAFEKGGRSRFGLLARISSVRFVDALTQRGFSSSSSSILSLDDQHQGIMSVCLSHCTSFPSEAIFCPRQRAENKNPSPSEWGSG